VMALVFMPAVAIGIPATEVLLVPLFGAEYAGAVLPYQITISLLFVSGAGALIGTTVLASGDARTPAWGLTIGSALSVALSFLVIPRYGATGAAWAAWIGEAIAVVYPLPKFVRVCHPHIWGRLLKIGLGSLVGTAGFYGLRIGFAVPGGWALAAAVGLTGIGLAVMGEISKSRWQAMAALFRKPGEISADSSKRKGR
jgi:O-antigen/teichoic acid export membrane protein